MIVNVPSHFPEGTVLDRALDDESDDLILAERKLLHAEIRRSIREGKTGHARPVEEALAELRARRRS